MGYPPTSPLFAERMGQDVSPQQRVEDMIRVTELCIDLLKENEEHHGEVGGAVDGRGGRQGQVAHSSVSASRFRSLP